jgi:transcriptional regulator with XRE-family HTH domain
MSNVTRIHSGKQPNRPHYIQAWAEHRGFMRAVDLAEALEVDKSLISRWYNGSTPNAESQNKLAALFHCDREALFRHPADDWMSRFFEERTSEEIERMKTMLEAAFPQKNTNAG